jgi:hypothetical protein
MKELKLPWREVKILSEQFRIKKVIWFIVTIFQYCQIISHS